ncbi:hypothetical protein LTR78_002665 [Recurvomyces mirabilis]|uniref:Uncharacterized protein n=1 Tax=Recurvomyces mirabilis TaxID=574656 RepID=A0AAE0WTF4_9PEZI|nr:hypothetical protein LTR78_002665 [Recurvomyces mirabilis]KAK5157594.1 hypothetical protein LTS14_004359 [Recurvomyces mirabilis]
MPRRKNPGFGVVPRDKTKFQKKKAEEAAHELAERRARTKDINWSSTAEMLTLMQQKDKLEDQEEYNKPALRSKQSKAVATEVARRSLARSVSREEGDKIDLGFALPSSGSPDEMPGMVTNSENQEEIDAAPAVTVEDVEAHKQLDPKEERWLAKSRRARKHSRASQKIRLRKQQGQAASEVQAA